MSIEEITSVVPHTPKYDDISRVYTKVDVGMRVAGYGYVTVTLDYFNQTENGVYTRMAIISYLLGVKK